MLPECRRIEVIRFYILYLYYAAAPTCFPRLEAGRKCLWSEVPVVTPISNSKECSPLTKMFPFLPEFCSRKSQFCELPCLTVDSVFTGRFLDCVIVGIVGSWLLYLMPVSFCSQAVSSWAIVLLWCSPAAPVRLQYGSVTLLSPPTLGVRTGASVVSRGAESVYFSDYVTERWSKWSRVTKALSSPTLRVEASWFWKTNGVCGQVCVCVCGRVVRISGGGNKQVFSMFMLKWDKRGTVWAGAGCCVAVRHMPHTGWDDVWRLQSMWHKLLSFGLLKLSAIC